MLYNSLEEQKRKKLDDFDIILHPTSLSLLLESAFDETAKAYFPEDILVSPLHSWPRAPETLVISWVMGVSFVLSGWASG